MNSLAAVPRLANIRLHPIKALDLASVFLLVLIAFYAGTNVFSPVRFDREKIEIYVVDGQVHVRGLYHYRNRFPLPVTFSLGLPFPVDAMHAVPLAYSVSEVSSGGATIREIATRNYHGGVVFRLLFLPSGEQWIRVDYCQKVAAPNARYILLTTRKWRQPLDQGEYLLHLGNDTELAASNYALQKSFGGQESRYSFAKASFFPTEDWIFSWKAATSIVASGRNTQ